MVFHTPGTIWSKGYDFVDSTGKEGVIPSPFQELRC